MNKIAIIIPARAGSKGIPQKNTRLLESKPLIYYAIKNALSIEGADVYVSTDCENIAHIAKIFGSKVLMRDQYADDKATLDEVIYFEAKKFKYDYQTIITLQATSPLLKSTTLKKALSYFTENNLTSLISTCEFSHLSWKKKNERFEKMYKKRVNRQDLQPIYVENGAFVICKADYVLKHQTRISDDVQVYNIPKDESVDIDSRDDWVLAQSILKRKNIALVTHGSTEIGMGHIYRALNLANRFINDNIYFFSSNKYPLGIEKIESLNYKVNRYEELDELILKLKEFEVDIVINDILDTQTNYISQLKNENFFVVNFEDTSIAAAQADVVINALYEWSNTNTQTYFGYKYEVLREDIYLYPVTTSVNKKFKNVLIGFGGTDIENATLIILKYIDEVSSGLNITVILGIGYLHIEQLNEYMKKRKNNNNVTIVKDVKLMAEYLVHNDLIVSGNGRMVYEVVALGIPLIVLSQNEREMSHIFPTICNGIVYLGYIKNLQKKNFQENFLICNQYQQRSFMNKELVDFAKQIRKGTHRVVSIINEKFLEVKNENF
jgi:CMP-N-acetylneuraminic acid synthetase/spore coat polysaccharide biosynthesis predicted glycosyltransferase SpsG